MSLSITIDKNLIMRGEGDEKFTVILGLIPGDSANPEDVYELVQTPALTEAGIAVRPYGLVVCPNITADTAVTFVCKNVVTGAETTMAQAFPLVLGPGETIEIEGT